MLVCNVSLRAPHRTISADLAEVAIAVEALGTGSVVFATLVDDPASVGDIVDAYLGEIMLEAASAADSITAGSVYAAAVDEAVTATDTQDATKGVLGVARSAMVGSVFVNSSTTSREAQIGRIMANL